MRLESQRGQTLPFWVIGVLISLSLLFFLSNYANAIAWQVRAQNAADSAASSALSVQANVYNEYTILLYSAAVDEYRLRVLNQALLNTLYGQGGCGNPGSPSGTCASDYATLLKEYYESLSGYTDDIHLLDQANNVTQGGQNTDQQKALGMMGTGCVQSNDYSCQFAITALNAQAYTNSNGVGNNAGYIGPGDNEIDVIACKNISYFGSGLLKIKFASYPVLGRAAAAVIPAHSEQFNPGKQINSQTGQVFQPVERQWAADNAPAYQIDFSGLTASLNWYTAGAIRPFATNVTSSSYTCKQ
jgi:putative Flp pilus-assembly TadE/G-like protein